jgi:hypothetical protein
MKNLRMAIATVNAQANVAAELFNGGRLELHKGVQPDDVDDDFLPRTPLVVFELSAPAFSKAREGRIDLYPLAPGIVKNEGEITWGRFVSADGRRLMDFTAGETPDYNMIINSTMARPGDEVAFISFSHRLATALHGS